MRQLTEYARTSRIVVLMVACALSSCEQIETVPFLTGQGYWTTVPAEIVNGEAIIGGDVNLGSVEKLRERARAASQKGLPDPDFGRWSNGKIPYTVAVDFAQRHRALLDSVIRQWENGTGIQFVPRTNETRYMQIVTSGNENTCVTNPYSDPVKVSAQDWCLGHEIGHALGLLHEHQRRDRDDHVDVNVPLFRRKSQYLALEDIEPCGPYDLASVMHYVDDRIRPLPNKPITRADNVISEGDRRAIAAQYGNGSCAK